MGKRFDEPRGSEITPEGVYLRRRQFVRQGALFLGTAAAVGGGLLALTGGRGPRRGAVGPEPSLAEASDGGTADSAEGALVVTKRLELAGGEALTSYADITTYNNFYEFGLDKGDPARHAHMLQTRPWTVAVEGEVARPGTIGIEDLLRFPLEERVYRMRCVEAWSMVIPWLGFPLSRLLERFQPTSHARFVAFQTLLDPQQMPGQRRDVLDWPYVEGLRLDEAMHPLTLMAVGLYGRVLPNQNGAPLRLVVPWKYGFKGGKSIVRIRLLREQPKTTWNEAAPAEYGFYANVNPAVDHPRWSQATERRIGEWRRRPTLPFNGYAEQVAHLYKHMDLTRSY